MTFQPPTRFWKPASTAPAPPCALSPLAKGGRAPRHGLSLFEVVISLAIFMASAAAIGQLVSSGVRGAIRARLETDAILRCESTMAEVVAGILPLQSAQETPFADDPNWVYSVSVTATPQSYLYAVAVSAAHTAGGNLGTISYTLSRLVRDPAAAASAAELQAELKAEQEQQSQSSSSSSGSGGSTGGSR